VALTDETVFPHRNQRRASTNPAVRLSSLAGWLCGVFRALDAGYS
jgi:hypothetical protein